MGEVQIHDTVEEYQGRPWHSSTASPALDTFAPFIPTLAQQAHVYALDLRGHNLSGRTPGAYQVPHATYAVRKGVGHGIHQEQPDAFVESLQHFVATASA